VSKPAQVRWTEKQKRLGNCHCGATRVENRKSCQSCLDRAKAAYAENPERFLQYKKTHRPRTNELRKTRTQRYKDACYAAYGGYVCRCCGETEPLFLDLDHIYNDGARDRKSRKWHGTEGLYRWIIKQCFPPIFQVLCRNCNWGKYRNGGICPHQRVKE
jgi:hypothetical protein